MIGYKSIRLVRDDGQELLLGNGGHGWMMEHDTLVGWDELDIEINSNANVLTDGSSPTAKRVNQKDRSATAFYRGTRDIRTVRSEAITFFNPKHLFRAYVKYGDITRWCEGDLSGFSCDINKNDVCTFTFTILCYDPYYKDPYRNDRTFTDSIPMFGFPFISHAAEDTGRNKDYPAGCVPSVRTFDGKNTVYNYGDVPCRFCAVVKARGALVNPTIHKDGKFIRVLTTMVKGDELVIDFEPQLARVTVNGENAIHKCDRTSTFLGMDMQVGANMFSFECDNEESNDLADVRILFNANYLGV